MSTRQGLKSDQQCLIPYPLVPCHDDHFPEVRSAVYLGYLPCLLSRVWPCGLRVSVFTPMKLFSSVELKKKCSGREISKTHSTNVSFELFGHSVSPAHFILSVLSAQFFPDLTPWQILRQPCWLDKHSIHLDLKRGFHFSAYVCVCPSIHSSSQSLTKSCTISRSQIKWLTHMGLVESFPFLLEN